MHYRIGHDCKSIKSVLSPEVYWIFVIHSSSHFVASGHKFQSFHLKLLVFVLFWTQYKTFSFLISQLWGSCTATFLDLSEEGRIYGTIVLSESNLQHVKDDTLACTKS